METDLVRENIKKRLNRIEGQVRGIQRMIDNDESCDNILIQIAAVRAAINKVGGMVLQNYAHSCIKNKINKDEYEKSVDDLIETIIKYTK
ncbi:MAG TPA: hypothetical protein DD429_07955 [Clostridiaceae bacterium]|nr:hypothetical protein [Clostridiaceae bacterium]